MPRLDPLVDDITFERVRTLPRRARVCSVHRQLAWSCHKQIQMFERDARVTTNNLHREKLAMQGKVREFKKIAVKLDVNNNTNKKETLRRSESCPAELVKKEKVRLLQDISKLKRMSLDINPKTMANIRARTEFGMARAEHSSEVKDIERAKSMSEISAQNDVVHE